MNLGTDGDATVVVASTNGRPARAVMEVVHVDTTAHFFGDAGRAY